MIIQIEVIVIVTGSTSMAARKNNKVICVSSLISAGIELTLFQLVVYSLKSTFLHVFLMKFQMISYMDAHSHTNCFNMMIWNKTAIVSSMKPEERALYFFLFKNKYSCYCRAVVYDVSKGQKGHFSFYPSLPFFSIKDL